VRALRASSEWASRSRLSNAGSVGKVSVRMVSRMHVHATTQEASRTSGGLPPR
jgi:hypothetical protein